MSDAFAAIPVPYSHPMAEDLVRCFLATGIPQTIAAAGTTAADATAIGSVYHLNLVTGADAAKGVILPSTPSTGNSRWVVNTGTSSLKVYPETGGNIDGRAADLPAILAPGEATLFARTAALTWASLARPRNYFDATATVAGLTTGTIPSIGQKIYVTATSASSASFITLPAPVVGTEVVINVGANGFKLQTSAPATVGINGGTGASASSAIAANSTCFLVCVSATSWKGTFWDADSDVAKIVAAS